VEVGTEVIFTTPLKLPSAAPEMVTEVLATKPCAVDVVVVTVDTQLAVEQVELALVREEIATEPPNPSAVAFNAALLESKGILDSKTTGEDGG
jgi:hypothetical protein